MRISVNLASRPFVELRPLFALLRLAMAALAVLAIGLGIGLHFLSKQARAAEDQMDGLEARTQAFQMERQSNESRMRKPENKAVLDRSMFLNDLFKRKSFSWTSVMMDLERVLPAGVQVTSIDPETTPDGDVNIRLRVNTLERDRAVALVRNLERSQRFLAPRLSNETAQKQEPGSLTLQAQMGITGVEFDILSGYNPLPENPFKTDKTAKTDRAEKTEKPDGTGTTAGQAKVAMAKVPGRSVGPVNAAAAPGKVGPR
jgi:type IV pilus assembly protein PilN